MHMRGIDADVWDKTSNFFHFFATFYVTCGMAIYFLCDPWLSYSLLFVILKRFLPSQSEILKGFLLLPSWSLISTLFT